MQLTVPGPPSELPPAPFLAALERARQRAASPLCIGLDPELAALPSHLDAAGGVLTFCRSIIDATADLVCAFKPNLAFFERLGSDGWRVLEKLLQSVPDGIPVIADGKRADIGNTSRVYAEALYDRLGALACTASPYLGLDALAPLLEHPRGFAFVLCRTSNPGAAAVQDLAVDGEPLFARVIRLVTPYVESGRAGLVIGAGERAAFNWAGCLTPGAQLLVPGVGAQGGTVASLARALSPAQCERVVVSVSRGVIHAGSGPDFAQLARREAERLREELAGALAERRSAAGPADAEGLA